MASNTPLSFQQRVAKDRRSALEALRDVLASALELAEVPVKAQIAGQLRQILRELDEMPQMGARSKRDELAAKRDARRAAAAADAPATKRRNKRSGGGD
jgi:hypothetical protein